MAIVGELSLWIALVMAAWAALVSSTGGALARTDLMASGARGLHASLLFIILACGGFLHALITRDFSVSSVAETTSANLHPIYTVAAFWASEAGSLLLWCLIVAAVANVAVPSIRGESPAWSYAAATVATLLAVLLGCAALLARPFARLPWLPPDGEGLRPDLQAIAFLFHPPLVYIGLLSTAIPLALAVMALATRRFDSGWDRMVRVWTMVAWVFATIGVVAGLWWVYTLRGWVGSWTAHPAENSTLIAWIAITALAIHTLPLASPGSARARAGTVLLAIVAFIASTFAVVVVSSSVTQSAQALARSSPAVWLLLLAVAGIAGAAAITRLRLRVASDGAAPSSKRAARPSGLIAAAIGAVVLAAGLASTALRADHPISVDTGARVALRDPFGRDWQFVSNGISRFDAANGHVTAVAISAYVDSVRAGLVTAELRELVDGRGAPLSAPVSTSGILRGATMDVHVGFTSTPTRDMADLRVSFHPLVSLVWVGAAVLTLGGLAAGLQAGRSRT